MGSFPQWTRALQKDGPRRITYVCGPQRALVRDVTDTTRKLIDPGPLDLHFASGADKNLWAVAFQHVMEPGARRLIVISDAEKISNWAPFSSWVAQGRALPGVHLLFVSNDDDLPRTGTGRRTTAKAHIELMKPPRGYVVRCTDLAEDDAVDWVKARSPLDTAVARHLLTRVGGDLAAAGAVCAKLHAFGPVTVAAGVIDQLVAARPGEDFVDSLLALNKRDAFAQIPAITDHGKTLGLLDSRLDVLAQLWAAQAASRYVSAVPGVNPFLVRRYLPMAKDYQPQRCAYRRQALAVVDNALRTGIRDGAWEVLVALW